MIVCHIEINKRKLKPDFISELKNLFYSRSFEEIMLFFSLYCCGHIKEEDITIDKSTLEESELFYVDNISSIKKRRALKREYFDFIDSTIFPLMFNFNPFEFKRDDLFVIDLKKSYIIGSAENMRYVNNRVMNKAHLNILMVKFFAGDLSV